MRIGSLGISLQRWNSGREFLGPIKSRLAREIGSSNIDFSIILASYSVNNTWTPLVAGLLASRLGTARTSLLATSLILGGQCILLLGRYFASVPLMAAGLFTFGLGISPVSVVQVGNVPPLSPLSCPHVSPLDRRSFCSHYCM
jgi:MFS family permease